MTTVSRKGKKKVVGQPIVMENGKVIDTNKTMIGSKAITEGLEYVSRMSIGLATGTLSTDETYLKFQEKILTELIKEQTSKTKIAVEKEERTIKMKYSNAAQIQQDVLDKMYAMSSRLADESALSFLVNDVDADHTFQVSRGGPVFVTDRMGGGWKRIDLKELKKNIEARQAKMEKLRKARLEKKNADIDKSKAKKKSKKKAKKKVESKLHNSKYEKALKASKIHKDLEKKAVAKKKVAKKKVKKARKNDRK